jgi:hypothetical protein
MSYVHEIKIFQNHVPIFLGEILVSTFPSDRPMYQEQVDIIQLQIIKRLLQSWRDIVGMVLVVP